MKRKNIYTQVLDILEQVPETRDSDALLCMEYIRKVHPQHEGIGLITYLELLIRKQITPLDSIMRIGRKIKETHIGLRGESYRKRLEKAKHVKKEMKEIKPADRKAGTTEIPLFEWKDLNKAASRIQLDRFQE